MAGWSDTNLSVLSGSVGTLLPLAVVIPGGVLADRVGQRALLTGILAAIGLLLVTFSALGDWWTRTPVATAGLIVWSLFDPLISVTAMPVLMAICRRGIEGSQFTAYMAVVNLTDLTGQYLTGWTLLVAGAPVIGLGCGLLMVVSAVLVARPVEPRRDDEAIDPPHAS